MYRIMFVCHGNICRSPMAEFILKKLVAEKGLEDLFIISSSATSDEEIYMGRGNPVYPSAKRELARHGISCEGKRAVQLKFEDYENYDYFVCMDSANYRRTLQILKGDKKCKVRKLLSYAKILGDVADPWYTYRFDKTYDDILKGCVALLDYLLSKGEKD